MNRRSSNIMSIVSMFKSGTSVQHIASALGLRVHTVHGVINRLGLVRRPYSTLFVISITIEPSFVADYIAGMKLVDMMTKYSLSWNGIYGTINRLNLPHRRSKYDHKSIINDRAGGMTYRQLIDKYCVSKRTLVKLLSHG